MWPAQICCTMCIYTPMPSKGRCRPVWAWPVISKLGRHPYLSKLGLKSCIFELLSMCWFQRTKNH